MFAQMAITIRYMLCTGAMALASASPLGAQQALPQAPRVRAALQMPAAAAGSSAGEESSPHVMALTLDEAIEAALRSDPIYATDTATAGTARLNHQLARSALLPNAGFYGQYLYTQANGDVNPTGQPGLQSLPVFIANNAVHEYYAQLVANETLSAGGFASMRQAHALAAKAGADLELARRNLVLRVVQLYFGLLDAENKARVARQTRDEAQNFLSLTQKLKAGREVAQADVVKAQLDLEQKQRAYSDAQLLAEQARLNLGTLLFPDPRTPYTLAVSPAPLLAPQAQVESDAAKNNPSMKSALEAYRAARDGVVAARAGYLPSFSFNYTYGIDAPQFAVNGSKGIHNLGYSASGGIDLPLWNWFGTHDRVQEARLQRRAAQVILTATQRTLIAQLQEYYHDAQIAERQLTSLSSSVKLAEESLRLTRLRYSAGEATALEVVNAEDTLSTVKSAQADGQLRYRVALANLQTLTGVL
jgi:outer membrane protein TolC